MRLPVTLVFSARGESVSGELQDLSQGGCFFRSKAAVDINQRISVVFSVSSGSSCRASGRVVRTVAYRGFGVLFDDDNETELRALIADIAPLTQEHRLAFLRSNLNPEIELL